MKIKIKPFVKRLIMDNIYYIIGNLFIFLLIIITLKIGFSTNEEYKIKINSLRSENINLMNKVTLMNSIIPESKILDTDIAFLNSLIPNVEDYFSVIYALEKLSQKSGFIITGYTVNVGASTSEKLKISVTGSGNNQSFINFLNDYNFFGGRLITSDKIELDPNFSGSLTINLTFYSKKTIVNNDLEVAPNRNTYTELDALRTKVNFVFDDSATTTPTSLDYPKKDNPF